MQKQLFPTTDEIENGETVNGMCLRKRKSRGEGSVERSKKRTRTAEGAEKEGSEQSRGTRRGREGILSSDGTADQATAWDRDGHDSVKDAVSSNSTMRRSARQAYMRGVTNSSGTSTPSLTLATLPEVDVELESNPLGMPPRRVASRARSSSSSASSSSRVSGGSITAVSESGSGADTCVEDDDTSFEESPKRKRHAQKDVVQLQEEETKVRASMRVRKLAPKMVEAAAQDQEEHERAHMTTKESISADASADLVAKPASRRSRTKSRR